MNILDFKSFKNTKKISMVTCYDFWSAQIIEESSIDCVLVGDSAAQVMHGYPSTIMADIDVMALHTAAVSRGLKTKFLIGDMPFLSVQKGLHYAMDCVEKLMKAGAHSVKIEGVVGHSEIIEAIVRSGVPVMGHLGLTPQSVYQMGGYKVQGRDDLSRELITTHAKQLEDLGCFSIVLECVPMDLATTITKNLAIPTIGIGAGPNTDGQVLVLHDLLGVTKGHRPKFLKNFLNGVSVLTESLNHFDSEVKNNTYPSDQESYQ